MPLKLGIIEPSLELLQVKISLLIALLLVAAACGAPGPDSGKRSFPNGHFTGYLEYSGKKLTASIDFRTSGDGHTALLTIPENLQLEKPFTEVRYHHPGIELRMNDGDGAMLIKATVHGDTITGKLSGPLPAVMRLVKDNAYRPMAKVFSIQDTFLNNAGIKLPARFYLPQHATKAPAVIFISGTGNHSREEYNGWAALLAAKGIAALTFDKRDVTSLKGLHLRHISSDITSMDELISDVEAAYRLLQSKKEIDPARIGIIGFSLGAVEAPVVAVRNPRIAFLVAVSGNATTDRDYLIFQGLNKYREAGYDTIVLTKALQLYNGLFGYVQTGKNKSRVSEQLKTAYRESWGKLCFPEELPNEDELKHLLTWNNVSFNPADYWRQIQVPSLVIYGDHDRYIPVDSSISILTAIFARKKHLLTIRRYQGTGHTIRTIPAEGAFDFPKYPPGYPEDVAGWISTQVQPPLGN